MKPYTYLIKHIPTGKVYYGVRSANKKPPEEDLWKEYFTSSPTVKQLITETGIESFEVQVRKVFETKEQAIQWEKTVLTRCQVLQKPEVWLNRNIAGYILPTEESCKKISEFHKGKPKSEDHKQKIKESNIGKNKGRIQTAEHRRKNSEKNSGENNPRFGAVIAEETRKKISEANKGKIPYNKGKPMSEEQKDKIRASKKANPYKRTPEDRLKQSLAQTGLKRTKETKEKISAALTGIVRGPMSESERLKRSKTLTGKPKPLGFGEIVAKRMQDEFTNNNPNKREDLKKVCPHCLGKFGPSNFTRWHGDRCQKAPQA